MILDIFNSNFTRIDNIAFYSYAAYSKKYNGVGNFEIQRQLDDESIYIMNNAKYILFEKDVLGIITYIYPKVDETTGERKLTIKGKLINFILSYRCIPKTINYRGTTTSIVRGLVNTNCIEPTDSKREMPIVLSTNPEYNPASDTSTIVSQITGGSLQDAIELLLDTKGFGYDLVPILSNTTITGLEFRVIKGKDRRINNTESNNPVVFSKDLKNILSSSYIYNSNDHKNMAYVAGENEGENRVVVETGKTSATGLNRKELYVDARDLQSEDGSGNTLSSSEYESALRKRGDEYLEDYIEQKAYDASIDEISTQYIYGEDYNVGDMVSIIDEDMGLTLETRITEVETTSMGNKNMLDITFGEYKVSTIDKLKKGVI